MCACQNALLLLLLSILTPAVLGASGEAYCGVVVDALSVCEYSTPGFDNLEPTQQASCLCGPSIGTIPWGPSSFDSYMNGCYSYEATASPAAASSLSDLQSFCASNYAARVTVSNTAVETITPGPTRVSTIQSTIIAPISISTTARTISSSGLAKSNTAAHPRASTFSVSFSFCLGRFRNLTCDTTVYRGHSCLVLRYPLSTKFEGRSRRSSLNF
jgi:hypothetical protein